MLKELSENSQYFIFIHKMFHGNFREKNTQLCHFLAMSVVLDLQLCWICNPTPLNISICDAKKGTDRNSRITNPNIQWSRIINPAQPSLRKTHTTNPAQRRAFSCPAELSD